jgi:hypothetical protein
MKLCEICNIAKLPSLKFKYCTPCKKQKRHNYYVKYWKTRTRPNRGHDDIEVENWICDCEEGFIIPKIFTRCFECGKHVHEKGKHKQETKVFYPEKDALGMASFIQSYFDRQNNGSI